MARFGQIIVEPAEAGDRDAEISGSRRKARCGPSDVLGPDGDIALGWNRGVTRFAGFARSRLRFQVSLECGEW